MKDWRDFIISGALLGALIVSKAFPGWLGHVADRTLIHLFAAAGVWLLSRVALEAALRRTNRRNLLSRDARDFAVAGLLLLGIALYEFTNIPTGGVAKSFVDVAAWGVGFAGAVAGIRRLA